MNSNQEQILNIARSLIGTPYKYAAKSEDMPKALDCSSFTQYAYKQIGIDIERSTILQASRAGKEINVNPSASSGQQISNLQIGDLLFFRGSKGHYEDSLFGGRTIYIGHVALYAGSNSLIHGSSKQGKITEENLDSVTGKMGAIVMIKRIL
ncbi:MAG: C40 family peptidase [bacterium]|nr:C40 family peptidase [bacterium]